MAGDPLWNNVIISMQFDGADGAGIASITDAKGHVFTGAGTPIISRTWGVTNGASLYLNGLTYISTPFFSGINFGASDFEISCWVNNTYRHPSTPNCILDCSTDSPAVGWRFFINPDGSVSFVAIGVGGVYTAAGKVLVNTPVHLAVTRVSGTAKIWVNGVEAASSGLGSTNVTNRPLEFGGAIGPYWPYYGFIDRAEIIVGAARHTGTFTPETTPFIQQYTAVAGTVKDETGIPCARTVRLYRRSTGELLGSTVSDGTTGAYSIYSQYYELTTVVALDNDAGTALNMVVLDRVLPI